ncbi:copper-binding protein [Halomonas huangheensis]|nr:copper-binding protein [Halomonas huangheensis]
MRKTLLALTLSLTAGVAVAAGEHGAGHAAASDADVDRTIRFQAGDMWFDPRQLEISPGETIRFEIANTGNLEHEFVIGNVSSQAEHRSMMREMSGGHGGHEMTESGHGDGMASVSIMPGETAQLIWTVPENADNLQYACNIPGHYEAGMFGAFELQK